MAKGKDDQVIPCRCLLAEYWPDLHQSVAAYVSLLAPEQKAPDGVYQARLNTCTACEHLRNGTCALCGCYVEARAAKRALACPDVPHRWEPVP